MPDPILFNVKQLTGNVFDKATLYEQALKNFFDVNYNGVAEKEEVEKGIRIIEDKFYTMYSTEKNYKKDDQLFGREIEFALKFAQEENKHAYNSDAVYYDQFFEKKIESASVNKLKAKRYFSKDIHENTFYNTAISKFEKALDKYDSQDTGWPAIKRYVE